MQPVGDELYRKVHALAQRQLERTITPTEHAELQSLLEESEDARRLYTEYVQETACLRWGCQEEVAEAVECVLASPDEKIRAVTGRRVRIARLLAGLAAAVMVAAGGLFLWHGRAPRDASPDGALNAVAQDDRADRAGSTSPAPVALPLEQTGQEVATITGLEAARWSGVKGNRLLSRCRIGERLRLDKGTAELTFDAGVQVTIFAPADFSITSAMSIRCTRGRVTTLVDERGKGFVIETPKATVEDLGTQFGVDISDDGETKVVVFRGSVDVTYPSAGVEKDREATRRLEQGDALLLNKIGEYERLIAVHRDQFLGSVEGAANRPPVIVDVLDNIRKDHSVKSYQIVPGGLKEDVPCFVDRDHEWNGIDRTGLPDFLRGADYIMPFNDDKFVSSLELTIYVARPATLYVFLDNNMEVPAWLRKNFKDTGVDIGLDGAPTQWHKEDRLATGAGRSIDFTFSVWQCSIRQPGAITLGGVKPPTNQRSLGFNMYGIAAVATDFATE